MMLLGVNVSHYQLPAALPRRAWVAAPKESAG